MWREYWWIILTSIVVVPLICIAGFGWWLQRRSDVDLEKGVKCWDVFVKLVSALTIVVSGAMIFGKYIDQQKLLEDDKVEQQRRELDLKKAEFLRQKLQFDTERHQRKRTLFDEVKGIAAKLANADKPDKATIQSVRSNVSCVIDRRGKISWPRGSSNGTIPAKAKGIAGSIGRQSKPIITTAFDCVRNGIEGV